MLEIVQKLERAWELRINRDLEECLPLCADLKREVQLGAGDFDRAKLDEAVLLSGAPWKVVADVALLWTSIVRTLQGVSPAARLIEEIDRFVWNHDPSGIFALHFEKGNLAYDKGDYGLALEGFLAASSQAAAPWEKLCSRADTLFCLNNLGLPQESALRDVENYLTTFTPSPATHLIHGQVEGLKMRLLFREGKISQTLSFPRQCGANQANFFQLWVRSLPYHSHYRPLSREELDAFQQARYFTNGKYRVRSLTGIIHPDDLTAVRPTEMADRLYLWVWKWLLNPEAFSIQKVTSQLKNINLLQDAHRMTVEDVYLISNSLLWLALFDPAHENRLLEGVKELEPQIRSHYPIFELESLLIHYCRSIRDGYQEQADDILTEMESYPLSRSRELYFCPLVKALRNNKGGLTDHLSLFYKHLRLALFQKRVTKPAVTVDLTKCQVSGPGLKKPILSRPMAVALELLRARESVPLEEFCHACFGFSQFDSVNHMPRIYNLLARLKMLKKSAITFRVKNGLVLAEGDWGRFAFVRGGAFSKQLAGQPEWAQFVMNHNRKPVTTEGLSPAKKSRLHWEGSIGRAEIEALWGRPRSSTNRILSELVKRGVVVRSGKTRHARYHIKNFSEIVLKELP
ncbi:MAG: MarR family transcriptional regulator [Deltaproteobacteria bacterium]|nr:MarR family transcriptional regulator [Deltaproteobacteria bacterium]